ncbi:MAG TPA: NfeD family protein [Pyrinomonadaceae bacterium]|jgi:membrane protein implicated in regulation of membrane protease activity
MRLLLISLLAAAAPAFALLAYVVHHSRQQKNSRRPLSLVGRVGSVERTLEPEGFVLVDGELWRARVRSRDRVGRGTSNVRVVGARDCVVEVEPLD